MIDDYCEECGDEDVATMAVQLPTGVIWKGICNMCGYVTVIAEKPLKR